VTILSRRLVTLSSSSTEALAAARGLDRLEKIPIGIIALTTFIADAVFIFVCIAVSSRWLPTSTPVVRQFPFSFQLTHTACLVVRLGLQFGGLQALL
jgi:hypothetical protein